MQRPIALKLISTDTLQVNRARTEPIDISTLNVAANSPAIIVARRATILQDLTTAIVDAEDIIAAKDGDWSNTIFIISDENISNIENSVSQIAAKKHDGDEGFFNSLRDGAPHLLALARKTVNLIRTSGVEGALVEKAKGRWVNAPLNSFTLKAQPRAGNIQFTLYGNPSSYEAEDFLLKDQNSYSRGWVKDDVDAKRFSLLVKQAHARRVK